MKKYLYFVLLLMLSVFVSCSEDEIVYSCDEQTDEWVKANLSVISNMSRQQWKTLPQSKKTAVFRAFSQKQKIDFWKDKLVETLKLDWTDAEKQHIMQLYNFIVNNPDIFIEDGMSDETQDKYDLFFYEWQEYAEEHLGWSMDVMLSIAVYGDEMIDKSGNTNLNEKRKINDIGSGNPGAIVDGDCHCNQKYDFCGFPMSSATCVDSPCQESSTGCGWVLASSCNGKCDNIY